MTTLPDTSPSHPSISAKDRQPGMERGFAMSPMAELLLEFNNHSDTEISLFRRTASIVSKKSSDISEVMNCGVTSGEQLVGRFCLETVFLLRTNNVIKEMQTIVTKASSLVEGRNPCFQVTHRILMTMFRGANDLDELQAEIYQLCVEKAQPIFQEYCMAPLDQLGAKLGVKLRRYCLEKFI
ncbi:hypothetical protein B0H13DRAFT_2347241 [Mycena leptocephala]|nr:hypothetical protein B0H13DRAFT_2347241 [Mycena leptocephala]